MGVVQWVGCALCSMWVFVCEMPPAGVAWCSSPTRDVALLRVADSGSAVRGGMQTGACGAGGLAGGVRGSLQRLLPCCSVRATAMWGRPRSTTAHGTKGDGCECEGGNA